MIAVDACQRPERRVSLALALSLNLVPVSDSGVDNALGRVEGGLPHETDILYGAGCV